MHKLTVENANAVEHRLAGDTLVFECPDCEWGEIVVTEMIEGPGGGCPDCGARFELFAEREGAATGEPAGGGDAERAGDGEPDHEATDGR